LGTGCAGCFKYLQEFVENVVYTDVDNVFPCKLLMFYNKGLLGNEEPLTPTEIGELRP